MTKISIILLCLFFVGCTDAKWKKVTVVGSPAKITCYSGGKIIYEGFSTGKVQAEYESDGYYFEDAETHKLVRVSGDCLIIN